MDWPVVIPGSAKPNMDRLDPIPPSSWLYRGDITGDFIVQRDRSVYGVENAWYFDENRAGRDGCIECHTGFVLRWGTLF